MGPMLGAKAVPKVVKCAKSTVQNWLNRRKESKDLKRIGDLASHWQGSASLSLGCSLSNPANAAAHVPHININPRVNTRLSVDPHLPIPCGTSGLQVN